MKIIKPKVYVASRYAKKFEVREIYKKLEDMGFEIARDWTLFDPVRPFHLEQESARDHSVKDIDAVANSDVFIILSDEAGTGMYVELGAAILSNIKFGRPKIFVVGPHNTNVMFYFHNVISRKDNIDEVLRELSLMKMPQ